METLFHETRRWVLARIADQLSAGENKLPTDRQLAEQLTASYGTIRLVMKELEQQGFLRRIRGSGTYISGEAAQLLAEENQLRLFLYAPEFQASPGLDFGAALVQAIRRSAEEDHWRWEFRPVRCHLEFLKFLEREAQFADGIIYLPPTEPFSMQQLGALSRCCGAKPLVLVDCELSNVAIANIATDNRRGGMLAANHLMKLGHREIGLLICEPPLPQSRARVQGFSETLELAGIFPRIIDCRVRTYDSRQEFAKRHTMEALQKHPELTAIFAISDSGAFGALDAFRELGLTVGRDISLIGFDGLAAGRTLATPLCTVAQPIHEIAINALRQVRTPSQPEFSHQLLSPLLIPGETAAPPRKALLFR